ncbi:SAM-dependent methyltransferase [Streptomyces sp. NPDC057445]|uniref:SAM-dependent methyltransferase n=1 Tax=Streptomyces sp. NPDC057445 TaxID=3346136 RepID=UPI0036C480EE
MALSGLDGGSAQGRADAGKPHPGRVYNALLGGKDHYLVDEEAATGIMRRHPNARRSAWAARHFMERSAYFLARSGIDQYLDVGCGAPVEPYLQQIVRHAVPDARVVCVDNDPIVERHAEALLKARGGRTVFVRADLADPASILDASQIKATLDLTRPVGLCLNNVLCFVDDAQQPHDAVTELVDALAPGSYVTISHLTGDFCDMTDVVTAYNTTAGTGPLRLRTRSEIERFFSGLELVDPGLVACHRWRPDVVVPRLDDGSIRRMDSLEITDAEDSKYAGVGRKV